MYSHILIILLWMIINSIDSNYLIAGVIILIPITSGIFHSDKAACKLIQIFNFLLFFQTYALMYRYNMFQHFS